MVKTVTITWSNKQQVQLEYPDSPLMEQIIGEIISGQEYPHIVFLDSAGAAVIDIGANIGCSALLFAVQYPAAKIYALEPSANSFGFLARNVGQHPNIQPIHVGAFNEDATAPMFPGVEASVASSLFPGGQAASTPGEIVRLRRISKLLDELGIERIALLKLDTEGAELPILTDLLPRLDRIDAIYVEYHSEDDRRAIDQLVAPWFILCQSRTRLAHRGMCGYLARRVISAKTDWDACAIRR